MLYIVGLKYQCDEICSGSDSDALLFKHIVDCCQCPGDLLFSTFMHLRGIDTLDWFCSFEFVCERIRSSLSLRTESILVSASGLTEKFADHQILQYAPLEPLRPWNMPIELDSYSGQTNRSEAEEFRQHWFENTQMIWNDKLGHHSKISDCYCSAAMK